MINIKDKTSSSTIHIANTGVEKSDSTTTYTYTQVMNEIREELNKISTRMNTIVPNEINEQTIAQINEKLDTIINILTGMNND